MSPGEDDDEHLWDHVTRDVEPLQGRKDKQAAPRRGAGSIRRAAGRKEAPPPPAPGKLPQGRDIDKRTAERVRRGQMKIEARLDLHGLTQKEAHTRLLRFITEAYTDGRRCVLVITGKGSRVRKDEAGWTAPEAGILKKRVPEWLDEPPLRDIVLHVHKARPHHGGGGALYVLLRRRRPLQGADP